eukprot:6213311-Pleurochrysis_carterae.AAC.2
MLRRCRRPALWTRKALDRFCASIVAPSGPVPTSVRLPPRNPSSVPPSRSSSCKISAAEYAFLKPGEAGKGGGRGGCGGLVGSSGGKAGCNRDGDGEGRRALTGRGD